MLILLSHRYLSRLKRNTNHVHIEIKIKLCVSVSVKPAPLDITSVQQDWQEVPPPIRSPVTRTFTRE